MKTGKKKTFEINQITCYSRRPCFQKLWNT